VFVQLTGLSIVFGGLLTYFVSGLKGRAVLVPVSLLPWVLQSSKYVRQTSVRGSKRSVTSPTQCVAVEAIGFLRVSP
jgi:hypothetical protein